MPCSLGVTEAQRDAMLSLACSLLSWPGADAATRDWIIWLIVRVQNLPIIEENASEPAMMRRA
jgi:hypothetical protein